MKKSKKKSAGGGAPLRAGPKPIVVEIYYTSQAQEDIAWWRKHDQRLADRIEVLIADIRRNPFSGIGKPEPLKHGWQGYWSRRINEEHRLVYRLEAGVLYVAQARYHY